MLMEMILCLFLTVLKQVVIGNCNNINNPLAKLYVPDVVKNLNVKMLSLESRTNETGRIEWHET